MEQQNIDYRLLRYDEEKLVFPCGLTFGMNTERLLSLFELFKAREFGITLLFQKECSVPQPLAFNLKTYLR